MLLKTRRTHARSPDVPTTVLVVVVGRSWWNEDQDADGEEDSCGETGAERERQRHGELESDDTTAQYYYW